MKELSETDIQDIISRVQARLSGVPRGAAPASTLSAQAELATEVETGDGIFATIDEAVAHARIAQTAYATEGLKVRHNIVDAIRTSMVAEAETLARLAHAETGLGRYEDKIKKNVLVATKTPGPEDLEPVAVTGDDGMAVTEWAPVGLVGAITPTTNPTSTIINNSISILSAGNAVVFNVHPNAKKTSAENIRILNRVIVRAGGPPNLITAVATPTLDSAKELMAHPDVRVLLVTGGPGVVKEALQAGKRAVTAGPGNPPVVVDETADIDKAAQSIVAGASFDNNVICTDEKEAIVVDAVGDRLLRAMENSGAYVLKQHELARLERVIFREMGPPNKPGSINPAFIGKNASIILNEIGVQVDDSVRLAVADVPNEHNLVWTEQMMPVFPVTRVPHVAAAIDLAVRAEHGFRHTAGIHSTNVDAITEMARAMNCSIFVANGPFYSGLGQGGEGYSSFSIASPSGDGLTRPRTFSRPR
ncbi:MAG: aldehyde dehydrogenase EutE, partial [Acidimicrobiia bacterium]|nr:aldehyde dehydrogenase EutE [Acidimicrobiia bacterium]